MGSGGAQPRSWALDGGLNFNAQVWNGPLKKPAKIAIRKKGNYNKKKERKSKSETDKHT